MGRHAVHRSGLSSSVLFEIPWLPEVFSLVGISALPQSAQQGATLTHLGVVVALKPEARTLTRKPLVTGEMLQLSEGTLLVLSGVGAKAARTAAEALLKRGATALLSWGTAGGLHAALSPGSLVLPEKIISPDKTTFTVDPPWHERLTERLRANMPLHTGPLLETSTPARTPSEKAALFKQYGAAAVDMESAVVARVADEGEVPFTAIRAVADPAGLTIPTSALDAIDDSGRLRLLRLLQGLARHPRDFFPLVRLTRDFQAARETLALVVRLTGQRLLAP